MSAPLSYDTLLAERQQLLQSITTTTNSLVGYIYPHAPIELFLAHNLTPTLLWADPKIPGAYEASLQTFCCAYSRNLFSQRAKEQLPKLAAIAFPGGTCDSLQNLGDVWRARFPEDTVLRLTYPVARNQEAVTYLAEELRNLSNYLEITFGSKFSLEKFRTAVALTAEFRAATQFIVAARIIQPSLYPYSDYSTLVRQFLTAPAPNTLQNAEQVATKVQEELRRNQLIPSVEALRYGLLQGELPDLTIPFERKGPQVAVVGGMIDPEGIAVLFENAKISAEIEEAEIVLDLLSFSFRTVFHAPPNLQGNPFQELAQSILSAPPEPTQEGLPERLHFLEKLLDTLAIDGLIIGEHSFCDPDQFEIPDILKIAKKKKVLTVRLPLDPEFSDRTRLEGRLQSFLETLSIKR
jgi:benzoyl-CoA reductase/2-hydroxyglutaryl-CoA dehydratase subunit BcrC/BadD/HgdB